MNVFLITGLPGVGKTTIVKRLSEDLRRQRIQFDGFYTEEVRDDSGNRSGFDVVTFDGQRSPLARIGVHAANTTKLSKVGRYSVFVSNFEGLALPVFSNSSNKLLVDEIGKMELLSNDFQNAIADFIKKLEDKNNLKYLIATIPTRGEFPIVNKLKAMNSARVFNITRQNRDNIYNNILRETLRSMESNK